VCSSSLSGDKKMCSKANPHSLVFNIGFFAGSGRSTIEMTPSRVAGFFGYFAVLSLVMLPSAVAFVRKKPSRWFLFGAGLLLLIGGVLNWCGLLPTFSWNGYEPDWPPICVGAFLVMMLLAIFGNVRRRRRRQR
jgi:hypothetical protein